MTLYGSILALALLSGLATLLGVALALWLGDLGRRATDTDSLANEFSDSDAVWDVWQARFDARDFEGAEEALL